MLIFAQRKQYSSKKATPERYSQLIVFCFKNRVFYKRILPNAEGFPKGASNGKYTGSLYRSIEL